MGGGKNAAVGEEGAAGDITIGAEAKGVIFWNKTGGDGALGILIQTQLLTPTEPSSAAVGDLVSAGGHGCSTRGGVRVGRFCAKKKNEVQLHGPARRPPHANVSNFQAGRF